MIIELIAEYGLFFAKTVTIAAACLFTAGGFMSLLSRGKAVRREQVQVLNLNEKFRNFARTLEFQTLPKPIRKKVAKEDKARRKKHKKEIKKQDQGRNRIFVLEFEGDIRASAVEALKEEVTAILTVAKPNDEVVLRLESSGGMVHSYGFAASQLMRLKKRDIPLTVAVDKVAASGGYLMACVADRIIAAPFAIIGSIGVVAQLPNFNRFLRKHDVDFEQVTAGEYKRTLTLFGENTEENREKLKKELEETHELFKDFVIQGRKDLDIKAIATGEHWYGSKALELKLVDELITSDDYLLTKSKTEDIFAVKYETKKSLSDKLSIGLRQSLTRFWR